MQAALLFRLFAQRFGTAAASHRTHRAYSDGSQLIRGASMEAQNVKIGCAQMCSIGDKEANYRVVESLAAQAAAEGCKMLFVPEAFSFIGRSPAEAVAAQEPLTGESMQRYCALARRMGCWLSLGGFQETGPDAQHIYNTHAIVSSNGEIVCYYRKIHLFDVSVPKGPVLMESSYAAPGDCLVACDSPVGRLGLSTCYDLRFPELYQKLVFDMGAQVLLVPSAFTVPTGRAHWEVLLRARAIETQTYVIAAAQAGKHNEKRESYGHAVIIDPWGSIIGQLDDPLATGLCTAEIDLAALQEIRTKMPIAEHRLQGRPRLQPAVPYEQSLQDII